MCGLVGCAGILTGTDEKAFNQMLILDSVRGIDSTGVAVIPRTGDVKIVKELGDPYVLMDNKRYDKAFYGNNRAIIGHNRWATVGGVSRHTAHPFEFSNIVGAHNGTLTTKHKFDDSADFTVDSEAMYHHINKKGLKDALQHMGGAWAMTWWDKEKETMNFLRNKERPLFLTFTEDGKRVFWASEAWMITAALSRNNIAYKPPIMIGEDHHFAVPVDDQGVMEKTIVRKAASTYVPVVYTPPSYPYQQQQQQSKLPPPPVTVPINKVTSIKSKKDGVVPSSTNLNSSKSGYAGSKRVVLELLDCAADRKGGTYFTCFDPDNPTISIRYYYNRLSDAHNLVGELITADIGELIIDAYEGGYYKVKRGSVEFEAKTFTPVGDEDDDPVVEAEVQTYLTHTGALIPYDNWMSQYGDCAWCTSPVLPTDQHILTTEGQCICQDCASDSDVSMYIKIAKGFETVRH